MEQSKVIDFLIKQVPICTMCAIRYDGTIVETIWIDYKREFRISEETKSELVKSHEWNALPIGDKDGQIVRIPCLFINVE